MGSAPASTTTCRPLDQLVSAALIGDSNSWQARNDLRDELSGGTKSRTFSASRTKPAGFSRTKTSRTRDSRIAVLDSLRARIAAADPDIDDSIELAANLALRTVQITYERCGLKFSYFIQSGDEQHEPRTVTDALVEAFDELGVPAEERARLGSVIYSTLRGAFYASVEEERVLFGRLSSTYALLFTLNTDPQLVEYFEEMASDFYLYVGTDELVRAMSERYLPEADQMTRNTLRIASEAGAT